MDFDFNQCAYCEEEITEGKRWNHQLQAYVCPSCQHELKEQVRKS